MPLSLSFLSEQQIDRIERTAFCILDEIGMWLEDDELLTTMRKAGARVDPASGRVRLSEPQIREALGRIPMHMRLTSVTGQELRVDHRQHYWGSHVVCPRMMDFEEGHRPPRLADVARSAHLVDALPRIQWAYLMDNLYADVPPAHARACSIATFFAHMTKHVAASPMTPADALIWLELAQIVAGGHALAERPLLSIIISPLSPLRLDRDCCQSVRYACSAGATFWSLSMPLLGVSGPFTLAGTAALQLAETFFLLTLAQTLRPGLPCGSHAGSWPVNLASGAVSPGSAERLIVSAALAEVHRRYGWPIYTGSFSTDVITLDVQNGAERMLQALLALSPGDLHLGMGSAGAGHALSPELIVMDHDLIETLDRVQAGMRVDDETLALEAVRRVGPAGDFTADELTLRLLRSGEYYFGGSFDRPSKPDEETGWYARAHARAEGILASHRPAVPEAVKQDLVRYLAQRQMHGMIH